MDNSSLVIFDLTAEGAEGAEKRKRETPKIIIFHLCQRKD
jgi:hypothetical protein